MTAWDQKPMDYENLEQTIQALKESYPWLEVKKLGQSLLGRNLYFLDFQEKATPRPKKKPLLITGAFHGMEWITASLLLFFAQNLCRRIQAEGDFLERNLVLVPCVNPDGVEIQIHGSQTAGRFASFVEQISNGDTMHWQANARGVDLNHNFDAKWHNLKKLEMEAGITKPAPTQFGGRFPESEPESRALARFCRRYEFASAFAFHSQGEEIYYDFGKFTPNESYALAQQLGQASGYTVSSPAGLASFGGFKDWFIRYFNRPGFTIEVGKGKNPLPLAQFYPIYEKIEPLLLTAFTFP